LSPLLTISKSEDLAGASDRRLVAECLNGSEEAWSALVDKYKALIYSIPVKYGLAPQEAADVFQITCLELLQRLPDLREPRALPKWLMQVAHHECYRRKRQAQRVVEWEESPDVPELQVPALAQSLIEETQQEQALREAIQGLSPRCQRLVELLFFETPARSYSEIAAELGLAVGSIGFNRQRCIEKLRQHLEKLGFQ
jgi:RNA polymerase sigma factor (sigma-70 family)